LQDVLNQLASLETAKLYHEDLRTWNILIDPDGRATLIDYGSITGAAKDCLWPHNIFLAFMIFVHGILPGSAATRVRLRSPALCPDEFPEPYRSVFWEFLKLRPDQWRFAFLRDRFLQAQSAHSNSAEPPPNGLALALQAMGEACNTYHETIQQIVTRNQQADAGWQRSVSVAHNNIGDMQRAQGDLPAALRSYQAAHDILSRLAQSDPASAEWQRDLAFGYGRVGVVQSEQGARDDARGALRHGRDIIARLMRQSPDSFTLPKDIAWFDTQLATLD